MSELFANKYRTNSVRLKHWDYSKEGIYFITICTKGRIPFFGEIRKSKHANAGEDGEDTPLVHTPIGEIAQEEWLKTPEIRSDMQLLLGEFVIMPDHMHGIICIGNNHPEKQPSNVARPSPREHAPLNQFGPQSRNLASIIRGYKSAVSTRARKMELDFAWQANYYEHIIRSFTDYQRIEQYILRNPTQSAFLLRQQYPLSVRKKAQDL